MKLLRPRSDVFVAAALLLAPMAAAAGGTVGDGTPASCTEAAFDAALAGDGLVAFDCGAEPVVIPITTPKAITTGPVEIDGDQLVTLAAAGGRLFAIDTTGNVTLRELTLANGQAAQGGAVTNLGALAIFDSVLRDNQAETGDGGAIHNTGTLLVSRSWLRDNMAANGGAIANVGAGFFIIEDSELSANFASGDGGAIATNANPPSTVRRTLVRGNTAGAAGGAISAGPMGAGLTVTNCTLAANTAASGGALYANGALRVANATLAANAADDGGAIHRAGGAVSFANSILAGGIVNAAPGPECSGAGITSSGHNVVDDASCAFAAAGDQTGVDPLLGPLADNGGPTDTHLLLAGSPAIDAGDPASCDPLDQRGEARPQDGDGDGEAICDAGAVEVPEPAAAACALAAAAALGAAARRRSSV